MIINSISFLCFDSPPKGEKAKLHPQKKNKKKKSLITATNPQICPGYKVCAHTVRGTFPFPSKYEEPHMPKKGRAVLYPPHQPQARDNLLEAQKHGLQG